MKVVVGTLKTAENEFEACSEMIRKQTYPHLRHQVYENLPNAEAHRRLFDDFLNGDEKEDVLIKVDADTVLRDANVVEETVGQFMADPNLEHIQYRLFDFFTNKPIWGLNCYRNTIRLKEQDPLFVDRFVIGDPQKRIFYDDVVVGNHSPDPSDFQALHFGFHRQLKKQYPQVIIPMLKAYLKTFNRKRAMALVGTVLVQKGMLTQANNSIYLDPEIENYSKKYSRYSGLLLFFFIISNYTLYYVRKLRFAGNLK